MSTKTYYQGSEPVAFSLEEARNSLLNNHSFGILYCVNKKTLKVCAVENYAEAVNFFNEKKQQRSSLATIL